MRPSAQPQERREACSTANDRFKGGFAARAWTSMIVATFLHVLVFQLWPDMVAADVSFSAREVTTIDLPDIEIPPKPEAIARPAMPVVSATALEVETTIAPTTFEQHKPAELPPPRPMEAVVTTELQPGFTPMTVRPEILNVAEVRRKMERQYPPILRDARIGGTVQVWFLVNEQGVVEETRIETSSGQQLLDQAALEVATAYRFSPARNRDQIVKVWVAFPITFRVDP